MTIISVAILGTRAGFAYRTFFKLYKNKERRVANLSLERLRSRDRDLLRLLLPGDDFRLGSGDGVLGMQEYDQPDLENKIR